MIFVPDKQTTLFLSGVLLGALLGTLGGFLTTLSAPYLDLLRKQNPLLHVALLTIGIVIFFVIMGIFFYFLKQQIKK